jgi:hypothetical protein
MTDLTIKRYKAYRSDKMIDILTEKERHTFNRCHYCDHQKYPRGRVIMPYDKFQRNTDKGDFMCGTCALELNRKILDSMNRRTAP